jgi:hypothetical protein
MKKIITTKTVKVDIFLAVSTEQYFEVPLDYEITGSTSKEAYQNLIDDYGNDDTPNAIHRPERIELWEYGTDFVGLGDEFCVTNNLTGEETVKLFASEDDVKKMDTEYSETRKSSLKIQDMCDFNYKEETLCEELASCIVLNPWGPMIKHHFINTFYGSEPHKKDEENGKMNEILRIRKANLIEFISKNDFDSAAWSIEKPWRIKWLNENKELIVRKVGLLVYYQIIGDVFVGFENAHRDKNEILELAYFGGNPRLMMNEEELSEFEKLPESFKVWRGVTADRTRNEFEFLGNSWTLDYEQAFWFTDRSAFGENEYPLIYGLTVNKEDVLSYFSRCNESEILIDFTKIDIEKVEFLYPKKTETIPTKEVDVKRFQTVKVN